MMDASKFDIIEMIRRGYFPKELPPAFNTFKLAEHYDDVCREWAKTKCGNNLTIKSDESTTDFSKRKKEFLRSLKTKYLHSASAQFSIAKSAHSRRTIHIPNPLHFLILVREMGNSLSEIAKVINGSLYSESKPKFNVELNKRYISPSSPGKGEFQNSLLHKAINKKVELYMDISKFYQSIYSHSISWACIGKTNAKKYHRLDSNNRKALIRGGDTLCGSYVKADALDAALRSCMSNQTIGIPVGPDTSLIIAELINSAIDIALHDDFPEITGCRYYDDYYLYFNSTAEAEKALRTLQILYKEYGLDINESKVSISMCPKPFLDDYAIGLSALDFKTSTVNSLKHFFSELWRYADDCPEIRISIFRYGLKIFDAYGLKIMRAHWHLFESLLLKTALIEPAVLDSVSNILLRYSAYIDAESKDKIGKVLSTIFEEHLPLDHHYELFWSLWLCKRLRLSVSKDVCMGILQSKDSISCLILLDIYNNGSSIARDKEIDDGIKQLADSLDGYSFLNEDWLLAYEGIRNGWLERKDLLDNNEFFSLLENIGVSFYDVAANADYKSIDYILNLPDFAGKLGEKLKCEYAAIQKMSEKKVRPDIFTLEEEEKQSLRERFDSSDIPSSIKSSIISEIRDSKNIDMKIDREMYVNKILRTIGTRFMSGL